MSASLSPRAAPSRLAEKLGPVLTLAPRLALSSALVFTNKFYNLALILMIGRAQGAAALGLFLLFMTISQYLAALGSFTIPNYFVRHGLRARLAQRHFATAWLVSVIAAAAMGAGAGAVMAALVDSEASAAGTIATAALMPAYGITFLYATNFHRAFERYAAQNLLTVALRVADLALVAVFLRGGTAVALWLPIYAAIRFGFVVAASLLIPEIGRGLKEAPRLLKAGRRRMASAARARRILRYSLPLVPSGFFSDINRNGDRFLVAAFLGKDMLGVYGSLYALGNLIGAAVEPFMNVLLPFLSKLWRQSEESAGDGSAPSGDGVFFAASFALYAGVCALALSLLMFAWGWVDTHYLTAEAAAFEGRKRLALIVGAGAVLFGMMRILSVRLFRASTDQVLWLFGATGLVNIALNLALIPGLGLMGAAWATIGSSGFGLGLAIFLNRGRRRA